MWVFLATEILFFGGMFTAYTIYRSLHLPVLRNRKPPARALSSAPPTPRC